MRCGAPATYLTESLDPNRPIGLCREGARSHDQILVTGDRDEVDRLMSSIAATHEAIRAERRRAGVPA